MFYFWHIIYLSVKCYTTIIFLKKNNTSLIRFFLRGGGNNPVEEISFVNG